MMTQKIFLVALSDPVRQPAYWHQVAEFLKQYGIETTLAKMIDTPSSPQEKAKEFNRALRSGQYSWIFDVSGGDLANLTLPWVDYEAYSQSKACYAGFSDCSVIVNALYAKTGKKALLYPIWKESWFYYLVSLVNQTRDEENMLHLFPIHKATEKPQGPVIGGNIRCFLKLAQTPYFPSAENSVLFLESSGCSYYNFLSLMGQLQQAGVLAQISGLILGRFNQMEQETDDPDHLQEILYQNIQSLLPEDLPVWGCKEIGHIEGSKGIWIGSKGDCDGMAS